MNYFINALKDASIYEIQPDQNAGRDEILDISKMYIDGNLDLSRSLIKFDLTKIKSKMDVSGFTLEESTLILRETISSEVPTSYKIFAYPVVGNWEMGIGTRFDDISSNDVTWDNKTTDLTWTEPGGDVDVNLVSTQSFEYNSSDIEMNVSNIVNAWVDETTVNDGFLVQFDPSNENDSNEYGSMKFFSKETNTIYQPKLKVSWDDSVFATGSLNPLIEDDIFVTFKRLKSRYSVDTQTLIRVFGRERFPLKNYTNLHIYNDVKYLPETTYYQIYDAITHEVIIPFSEYSKVSCGDQGNFFRLDFSNWETNRSYYIGIKTVRNGVEEMFIDDNLTFTLEV